MWWCIISSTHKFWWNQHIPHAYTNHWLVRNDDGSARSIPRMNQKKKSEEREDDGPPHSPNHLDRGLFCCFYQKQKAVWHGIQYKCVSGNINWDWWLLPYVTAISLTTAEWSFFSRVPQHVFYWTANEVTEQQSYLLHCWFVESGNSQSNVQLRWNLWHPMALVCRVEYGNQGVGVVSQQLYKSLTSLQMGNVEDWMGWTVQLNQ